MCYNINSQELKTPASGPIKTEEEKKEEESMKNVVATLVALIVVCLGFTAEAQMRTAPAPIRDAEPVRIANPARRVNLENVELKKNLLAVMDVMVQTYGQTDFSPLVDYIKATPSGSPNNIVPVLTMAHAYLNRYETGRDDANLGKALAFFEVAAQPDVYGDQSSQTSSFVARIATSASPLSWGKVWASSPTAAYLMMGIARLRLVHSDDAALTARIEALDLRAESISAQEADRRLGSDFPSRPYISGTPRDGDSKSEENAWEAYCLLWASQTYPSHPHAPLWEAKGLELAFHSFVTPSEARMLNGEPFSTIEDDGTIRNHWLASPWYGNPELLQMAALAYRLNGKSIPSELLHNTQLVYDKYRTYCVKDATGRWIWDRPSDPAGDPSIFPIPGMGDDEFVRSVVRQKAADGWLWLSTEPVTGKLVIDPALGFSPESHLWRSVQNGKVVWYYLTAYLWYFPPTTPR